MHQEVPSLHTAAYLLASSAFLSQLLAIVREALFAHTFGASHVTDLYSAAFRIPDLIFVAVASLVSISVLVPFLVARIGEGKEALRQVINSVFTAFALAIVVASVAMFFLLPYVLPVLFGGFTQATAESNLLTLSRVMLLSPILLGLSTLLGSITQAYRKFFLVAVAPLLYNLGIIMGVWLFYPIFGIAGLAYGVVLGAFLHMAIQLPFVIKHGLVPRFGHIDLTVLGQVLSLSLPRTIALSAHHITILILIALATRSTEGAAAVFTYAYTLQSVPLSIIGVSYSVAAFPTLAKLVSQGEQAAFLNQMVAAVRHIVFWSLPAMVLFIVLRAQIVRTIFGSGAFDWADTRLTAAALALFMLSIIAQSLMLLFVRGYYAAGETRKPLVISLIALVTTVVSTMALVHLFTTNLTFRFFVEVLLRVTDIPGTDVLMLPLSFSLGMLLATTLLWWTFQHDFTTFFSRVSTLLFHGFGASVIIGVVSYGLLQLLDDVFNLETRIGIFSQGALAGLGGILAGIIILKLLNNHELHEVWLSLHQKFWNTRTIAAEQGEL